MTDHDLLIKAVEKLDTLGEQFTNHLKHHFWTNIALLSIIGSLVIAVIVK